MQAVIAFINRHMIALLKFALVGTSGLIIDFGITLLLRDVLLLHDYLSGGGGFVFAAVSNYYLNSKWTFKGKVTASRSQFLLFFAIALAGLCLHLLLLHAFLTLKFSFYTGKALAIGCVVLWNFSANSLITFRKKKDKQVTAPLFQQPVQSPTMTSSKQILFTALLLSLLIYGCQEQPPTAKLTDHTIRLDSSLGIGNKFQTVTLPGRLIVFNPDSANKIIVIGEKGTIINTIYKGTGDSLRPQSLKHITVDSSAMEFYVYSPQQRVIFVYDSDGYIKNKISIEKVHDGSFTRMNGNFIFFDTLNNKANFSIVDSTGKYVDSL